jgi:sterol 24-C-methyltransferase
MMPTEDYKAVRQQMHGTSSEERNAFLSLLQKDSKAHGAVTREYVERWTTGDNYGDGDKDVEAGRELRKGEYMSLVNK